MAEREAGLEGHDLGGGQPPGRKRRHTAATAEYIALLALAGVFLWRGFIPAWKSLKTDFPDYYLAAHLYHQGYSLDKLYDWTWVQRQKDHAGIEQPIVTFTLLTPFSLLPVLPFSSLPPLPAKRGWLLVNLILLAVAGYFLFRMTSLGPRRVAILMFLALVPLRTNFLFGQEYVLLLFLLVLAAWAYLEGRSATSGVILAVAGGLKIYPALYVIFFARKKQWRAAAGLLVGSLAIWVASVFLFGFETIRTYVIEVLPWPLRGEGQDPYNATWNSFTAMLHRLFVREPELNPHPIIHLPAAYAILQPVCQGLILVPFLWLISSRRSAPDRDKLEWAGFAAMLLMLSTNPASYDFNALILTAVLTADYLLRRDRRREAAALIILYAFVCFPTYRWAPSSPEGWQTLLAFPRLWAMTGLWVCILTAFLRSNSGTVMARLKSREAATFGMIFLVLVALGVITNLLQQRGEFKSYSARVLPPPGFLLATDPAVANRIVLFTVMTADGYGTKSFGKGSLNSIGFGEDSFHPATAPGLPYAWVELASSRSRIVRFPLNATGSVPREAVVEAENAEKPAVSPDGKWLTFIRETQGRGALFAKKIELGNSGARVDSSETQLSPMDLDVLDATFDPTDHIIFSARRERHPRLYTVSPQAAGVAPLGASTPRRFPAVSPDGRWLAFSQREGSYWQLWLRNLATGRERRLTDSDCNAIASAWDTDSKHMVYATDCGRGFWLTALCRIEVVPRGITSTPPREFPATRFPGRGEAR